MENLENLVAEIEGAYQNLNLDYWQHGAENKCLYQEALKDIADLIKKYRDSNPA